MRHDAFPPVRVSFTWVSFTQGGDGRAPPCNKTACRVGKTLGIVQETCCLLFKVWGNGENNAASVRQHVAVRVRGPCAARGSPGVRPAPRSPARPAQRSPRPPAGPPLTCAQSRRILKLTARPCGRADKRSPPQERALNRDAYPSPHTKRHRQAPGAFCL